jgi:hypothetical protein
MTSPDKQPSSTSRRESLEAGFLRVHLGKLFADQAHNLITVDDKNGARRPVEKFLGGHALLHSSSHYSQIAIRSWRIQGGNENISISIGSKKHSEQYLIDGHGMTKADTQSVGLDDVTIKYLNDVITSDESYWTKDDSRDVANAQLELYEILDRKV